MEEPELPSKRDLAIKYGVIQGLISISIFLILDFTGLQTSRVGQWSGLAIFAVVLYFAHDQFKKEGDGFLNYSEGLGLGTLISFVSSTLSSILSFLYISFINTEYLSILKEQQLITFENQGLSDEQIDQAVAISEMFMSPMAIFIMGIVFGVLFGFLLSLVVSAFTRKPRPEII